MSNPSHFSEEIPSVKTFYVNALKVRLYDNDAELSQDAAKRVCQYLQEAIAQQGEARVLLATGNSQIKFLDAAIAIGGVDWSKIEFFHLDEYLGIDRNNPVSFRRYLRDRVETRVHPKAFHYIEGDAIEPLAECDRYTKLLQEKAIDLCCLGIGENGHIAFNEPAVADFSDPYPIKLVKLAAATHQQLVKQGHFSHAEAVPKYAFTLTLPTLCTAKKIICLAPEKRKANIVKRMLSEPVTPQIPATILRSQPDATLFLDRDSASEL